MTKYPFPFITLHWLTAVSVILAYLTSGDPTRAHSSLDALIGQLHVATGMLVFALVCVRVLLRLSLPMPPQTPSHPLLNKSASAAHLLLYLLLFLTPLAGWSKLSAKTTEFSALGWHLPLLPSPTSLLAALGNAHELIGNAFITLVGLHALAAIFHHVYLKDGVLQKMLPRRPL